MRRTPLTRIEVRVILSWIENHLDPNIHDDSRQIGNDVKRRAVHIVCATAPLGPLEPLTRKRLGSILGLNSLRRSSDRRPPYGDPQ